MNVGACGRTGRDPVPREFKRVGYCDDVSVVMTKFFVLVQFVLLIACAGPELRRYSSQDLLLSPTAKLEPQSQLSSQNVEDDIELLIYALNEGYEGQRHLKDDSYEKVIHRLRRIPAAGSSSEFRDKIDEILFTIPDEHLQAKLLGYASSVREKTSSISGSVGMPRVQEGSTWAMNWFLVHGKRVLYLALKESVSFQDPQWEKILRDFQINLKKSDAFLLDLRGNAGGEDTGGIVLGEILNGGPISYPVVRQYQRQTPVALALWVNDYTLHSIKLKWLGKEEPSYQGRLRSRALAKYENAFRGEVPNLFTRTEFASMNAFEPGFKYRGPVRILIDRECASACESIVLALENLNNAKTVGERTRGAFHFTGVGTVLLPNSRVEVTIPTHFNELKDQRWIERVGIAPAMAVSPRQDAFAVAMESLKNDFLRK